MSTITDPAAFTYFDNGTFETAWPNVPYPQNIYTDHYVAFGASTFQRSGEQAQAGAFSGKWMTLTEKPNTNFLRVHTGKTTVADRVYKASIYFRFLAGGGYTPGDQTFMDFRLLGGPVVSVNVADAIGQWVKVDLEYPGNNTGNLPLYMEVRPRVVSSAVVWPAGTPLAGCAVYLDTGTAIEEVEFDNLEANATSVNVTTAGGSDGSITVNVTNGTGQYEVKYNDGFTVNLVGSNPQSTTRTGLPAGGYQITVKDLLSLQEVILNVELTDPVDPPKPAAPYFNVPFMNSIHFVNNPVNPDGCNVLQTPDNVLFCQQKFPFFSKANYFQKVARCTDDLLQFYSTYDNHEIQLFEYVSNALIKTFTYEMKEQNVGKMQDFQIYLRNHIGHVGQSRVYFQIGPIPIPLQIGDFFTILNNLDGFNGSYAIVDIEQDVTLGVQYLVINKAYATLAPSSNALGQFSVNSANFNVYESPIPWGDVLDGVYFIRARAFNSDGAEYFSVSEPIDLKDVQENTLTLTGRNIDNSFDMTFTTGYTVRLRVTAVMHNRLPGGERSVTRDSDYSLVKINAKMARVFMLSTFNLPPYMHEKLAVLFNMDIITINGIEFQTEEGYGEPKYLTRYPLANSEIKVEQVGWFDRYNSDDIGTIADEGGFVIADDGLVKYI